MEGKAERVLGSFLFYAPAHQTLQPSHLTTMGGGHREQSRVWWYIGWEWEAKP
jgi:hypothetical protein